ncbi:hypothetical protein [Methanoregula sp.]|uniref:hypothetical protein n=1 Tax=Methanoregula sp. TaxID=2052170 RepID=UPI003568ADDC
MRENPQPISPWVYLFGVIAFAIGCILFGNYILGNFSDSVSTGFGNQLMAIGTTILLTLGIAAAIVLGIMYLIYWLFYKPQDVDPYQY